MSHTIREKHKLLSTAFAASRGRSKLTSGRSTGSATELLIEVVHSYFK